MLTQQGREHTTASLCVGVTRVTGVTEATIARHHADQQPPPSVTQADPLPGHMGNAPGTGAPNSEAVTRVTWRLPAVGNRQRVSQLIDIVGVRSCCYPCYPCYPEKRSFPTSHMDWHGGQHTVAPKSEAHRHSAAGKSPDNRAAPPDGSAASYVAGAARRGCFPCTTQRPALHACLMSNRGVFTS